MIYHWQLNGNFRSLEWNHTTNNIFSILRVYNGWFEHFSCFKSPNVNNRDTELRFLKFVNKARVVFFVHRYYIVLNFIRFFPYWFIKSLIIEKRKTTRNKRRIPRWNGLTSFNFRFSVDVNLAMVAYKCGSYASVLFL